MNARVRGEFMRSPTRKAKQGVAPRHAMTSSSSKRKVRKKRSKINQLGLIALIAFIFFTPDAKQFVLAKWAEIEDYIMEGLAPHQVYPLEAEYTVVRSIDLWNNGSGNGHLEESIPIPMDVTSNEGGAFSLAYTDGTEIAKSQIQEIIDDAQLTVNESTSLYGYTRIVNDEFEYNDKLDLLRNLWKVAYADDNLDKYEEHLLRKISDLIHISHSDYINIKLEIRDN